jgi:hypothetical protein
MSSVIAASMILFMSIPVVGVSFPPMRSNMVGLSSWFPAFTSFKDLAPVYMDDFWYTSGVAPPVSIKCLHFPRVLLRFLGVLSLVMADDSL